MLSKHPFEEVVLISLIPTRLRTLSALVPDRFLLLLLCCGACICYIGNATHRALARKQRQSELSLKHGCQPPVSYPCHPLFFGLDLLLTLANGLRRHTYLVTVQRMLQRCGNTVQYQILGTTNIVTIDPENIKTMLSRNFGHYSMGEGRKADLRPVLGNGIFNSDGNAWEHSRTILKPHFVRDRIDEFGIYEHHLQRLISILPHDRGTIDLQALFFNLSMDIVTDVFFGQSTDSLSSATTSSTSSHANFSQALTGSLKVLVGYGDLDPVSISRRCLSSAPIQEQITVVNTYVDAFVKTALDKNRNSQPERHTYLNELLKHTTDTVKLRFEVNNILIAGRDSTASLLSSIWFVLARRQDVWAKVRDEVEQLHGRLPSPSDIRSMTYLNHVLKECLRLMPPVPINYRVAEVDTILPCGGGMDGSEPIWVPKGTLVAYSLYAMHRRPDIYGSDAEAFRPERWDSLKPGWAYLPFHGGPRTCLSQRFARTEVSYIVVRLMQTFRNIEARDSSPWEENMGISCSSRNGVQLALW